MKSMKIFEPAMCCPTGLCGVGVDPELLRISAVLDTLKKQGVIVHRFNLNNAPMEFVNDAVINAFLGDKGPAGLPAILLDETIVLSGRYPTNDEFTKWLGLPDDMFRKPAKKEQESGECCCNGGSC